MQIALMCFQSVVSKQSSD